MSTAVTMVESAPGAVFMTDAATAKVKRIRNFPGVQVAASTFRGEATSGFAAATARRLHGDEALGAQSIMRRAHPIIFGIMLRARYATRRTTAAYFELSDLRELSAE